jgi:hypothetical protein
VNVGTSGGNKPHGPAIDSTVPHVSLGTLLLAAASFFVLVSVGRAIVSRSNGNKVDSLHYLEGGVMPKVSKTQLIYLISPDNS